MAPAILMNTTNHAIEYWQSGVDNKRRLEPNQMIPFSWDDIVLDKSADIPRLEWNSGDGSGSDALQHNRDQSYLPSRMDSYHYCVSFLNGRQRVFLVCLNFEVNFYYNFILRFLSQFTSDEGVSFVALQAYEIEQPNIEVQFCLHGVGISIVNNLKGMELIYMVKIKF